MTPDIRPFLLKADQANPSLRVTNTAASCFDLLRMTLAFAGPEWAFIGKALGLDGSSVAPAGFRPFTVDAQREDGQTVAIRIIGLSQDAAWHLPSGRQVKVIANSSANDDPRPEIHGPANLSPYGIEPQHYRWHNPPVPQDYLGAAAKPPVIDTTPSKTAQPYPDENVFWKWYRDEVDKRYKRVQRRLDPSDLDSIAWFTRPAYMIGSGLTKEEAAAKYLQELEKALGL